MTLYLVKYGADDWRLHADDGEEIGSGQDRPDKRTQVDWLSNFHNGASILSNPEARGDYTDIVTGEVRYRDMTMDGETVPW